MSLGQAKIGLDFRLPLEAPPGTLALTGGAAGVFSTTDGARQAPASTAPGRASISGSTTGWTTPTGSG